MQAVILLGGKGTRISALYPDRPKALVPVAGRPILVHQLNWLASGGIGRVHLAAGHMADRIEQWLSEQGRTEGSGWSIELDHGLMRLSISTEPRPLGTGGGLRYVQPFLEPGLFWAVNGDSLAPAVDFAAVHKAFDAFSKHWNEKGPFFQALEENEALFPSIGRNGTKFSNDWKHLNTPPVAVVAVAPMKKSGRYGTVEFTESGRVTAFLEKAERQEGWINAGVYAMDTSVLELLESDYPISLETDVFPALATCGLLQSAAVDKPLLDMGTPDGLEKMESYLTNSGREESS